jgi:AcrR family transcriptional regulator
LPLHQTREPAGAAPETRLAKTARKPKAARKPKREQSDETIDKVLTAARGLFVSRGYRGSTLDQIAAAAGLSKGAVYFHFGSKEAVLLQLLKRVNTEVLVPVIEILNAEGLSTFDKLIKFTRIHGEMGITKREELLLLILMSVEFAGQTGEAADYVKSLYTSLYAPLEALVCKGQAAGEIRRDAPSPELAAVIIATHDGAFLEWYRRGGELDGRHLVRATLSVLLHGM